jgi:hypothetical protein
MAALNLVVAGEGLDYVAAAAERGIQPIPSTPHRAFFFVRSCGLSLWSAAGMPRERELPFLLDGNRTWR